MNEDEQEIKPLCSRKTVASPSKKKYRSLLSVGTMGMDKEDKEAGDKTCYNCGKKGHWFVDCFAGCGRCGGDGHRTMDCSVVRSKRLEKAL